MKKIRIEAGDLGALHNVLRDSNLNLGCRPIALRVPAGFSVAALVNDGQLQSLQESLKSEVRIAVEEELPDPDERLRMISRCNRFLCGELPRGLGRKE